MHPDVEASHSPINEGSRSPPVPPSPRTRPTPIVPRPDKLAIRAPIHKPRTGVKPAPRRSFHGGRGQGYTREEVQSLLDVVEEYLPLGPDDWEYVRRVHEQKYQDMNRDADSVRRKFASLHRTKLTSTDSSCPPEVYRAKSIRSLIIEKANNTEGHDVELVDAVGASENGVLEKNRASDDNVMSEEMNLKRRSVNSPRATSIQRHPVGVNDTFGDLIALMRLQMMQEQRRRDQDARRREAEREEQRVRWEQERAERAEDRKEQRERWHRETERHNRMMEMLMLAIVGRKIMRRVMGVRREF